MDLELLAGGNAQRAVAGGLGHVRHRQILRGGGELTAGHADPDHQLILLLPPFSLDDTADVAIVLLVGAVKLQDGRRLLGEAGPAVADLVGHKRPEVLAGDLDRLGLAGRLLGCPIAPTIAYTLVHHARPPSGCPH